MVASLRAVRTSVTEVRGSHHQVGSPPARRWGSKSQTGPRSAAPRRPRVAEGDGKERGGSGPGEAAGRHVGGEDEGVGRRGGPAGEQGGEACRCPGHARGEQAGAAGDEGEDLAVGEGRGSVGGHACSQRWLVLFRASSWWVRLTWTGMPGRPPTLMRNLPRPGGAASPPLRGSQEGGEDHSVTMARSRAEKPTTVPRPSTSAGGTPPMI